MTPQVIADFMASLFCNWPALVRLLDPGAGVGSLTEAFSERFISRAKPDSALTVDCYEIEPRLSCYLTPHLSEVEHRLRSSGHRFTAGIHQRDFIADASHAVSTGARLYTHAILNPPYKKIGTQSDHRKMLRTAGIETVNLYTAFLGLVIALMEQGGEIVAIIPRSFCNGAYFRPFRQFLLSRAALTHIHVFDSRTRAFREDEVLQENIIVRLVRGGVQGEVSISTSQDAALADFERRLVAFSKIVKPDDREQYIHVPGPELTQSSPMFVCPLEDLGVEVATGPVVDFRLKQDWLAQPEPECVPLLYTHHFRGGVFMWPKPHKKPNALRLSDNSRRWLLPRGWYTLTKRFSSKEERRRLVAYVVNPELLPHERYGFENHLNVFHIGKRGLTRELAHGLAVFLNSSDADRYFRTFSGHTQVNATDLRTMRFPTMSILEGMGEWAIEHPNATQAQIDGFVRGLQER